MASGVLKKKKTLIAAIGGWLTIEVVSGSLVILGLAMSPTSATPRPVETRAPVALQPSYNAPTAAPTPEVTPKPTPKPTKAPRPTVAPIPKPVRSTRAIDGIATWFCLPGTSACTSGYSPYGYYAAAGPELRAALGDWRGRYVKVCDAVQCVTVRLIDFCGCGGGHTIDLYAVAFSRLAPLSRGELAVTIHY